ncbi:uncharacterized protein LOC122506430 [Leptopilina heterotoma]|uniref:uncharacterized protein LOC122506430 n=1 Tax=Leptopilina heterotoma TaxID=63436 RepID=UPI001CA87F8D|nr:uncharacterized protein LOC122506430 [Leptopilina heterotoma]
MSNETVNNGEKEEINGNESLQETKLWLDDYLIPKLKLSLNQETSVSQYKVVNFERLFISDVIFLDLELKNNNNVQTLSLVIKRPNQDEAIREYCQIDKLFHNEILFYENYMKNSCDYPQCFYTNEKTLSNKVVVVENINKLNYHKCPQKVNVNMEYILAAMQEIGEFHAKGYVLKSNSPSKFHEIVNGIQESRYEYREKNIFPTLINNLMPRIIKCLRERNYDQHFCDKAEKFFQNSFENCMQVAMDGKNIKLATLCHGDFTIDNVFFKKTEFGCKAMLIDFAMLSYASPAIDLSTFIYLSMSPNDIRTKFHQVFDVYYNSIIGYFKKINFSPSSEFAKENFLNDYKKYALFGFMIAAFYLPIMHGLKVEKIDFNDAEKNIPYFSDIGGDKFRDILLEMFIDMKNNGCMEQILS